jgi:TetR/AcrR family transcriptional regulator, fatty acid biosynthesis regulator
MPRRALGRKEAKEVTRRRLIDGAIDILRREGVAAATTGRIAEAAGIAQSSFYGHFTDRDQCLEAAAELIGGYVLHQVRKQRSQLDPRDLRASLRALYASVVQAFLSAPELTRIFLRHRTDDQSALGRAFREQVDRARVDLDASLRAFGVTDAEPALTPVYVELLITGTLGVVEGLLDERIPDREAAIDGITNVTHAGLFSLLHPRSDR